MPVNARCTFICPYCGFHNNLIRESELWTQSAVIRCDSDSGGCGKQFVIDYGVEPFFSVRMIEGEK